jgi:hypothetical protein
MKYTKQLLALAVGTLLVVSNITWAQEPKYAAKVPDSVKTPDKVQTEFLGDLEFFDGAPSRATVEKAYDFLDLSRGTTTFLKGIPAASVYALLEGLIQAGVQPGDLGITEDLMDARSLFSKLNYCLQLCGN